MCDGANKKMVFAFSVEHSAFDVWMWLRVFTRAGEHQPTRRKYMLFRRVL